MIRKVYAARNGVKKWTRVAQKWFVGRLLLESDGNTTFGVKLTWEHNI